MRTGKEMAHAMWWITSIFFTIILSLTPCSGNLHEDRQLYIVYMGSLPEETYSYSPEAHHINMLQSLNSNIMNYGVENVKVTSYKRSFNGFAAWLTGYEVQKLNAMEEVKSVFPNVKYQLQTTRSWDFMGFPTNIPRKPTVESDVIIGLIDSGLASKDSPSFSDEGFGPVPSKWKGYCKSQDTFVCNKKVIGGMSYGRRLPPLDDTGHGTHTASIAAGNIFNGASFYGIAKGIARGGVPSARIASYCACQAVSGCDGYAILASFDDAIADGVDILSVSLGRAVGRPDRSGGPDVLILGSFHALEKGILTVHSAGNNGPDLYSVSSYVPWLLSVGATTTDRQIIDKVVLGDGTSVTGRTINAFDTSGKTGLPIIHGQGNKSASCNDLAIKSCVYGCLDPKTAKGKIVLCDSPDNGPWDEVHRVQGGGLITTIKSYEIDSASVSPLAGVSLTPQEYNVVLEYVKSSPRPTATILKSTSEKNTTAPIVASFSSRGPNSASPHLNKPDLVAPGVEILAAFSPIAPLTGDPSIDKRSSKYNIISGTSMACPHVTGAAAYVKTFHPHWSPSAIKSALMTSAQVMNEKVHPEKEFAYGSGFIDPVRAVDPGLIYELSQQDYRNYICTVNGNTTLGSLLNKTTVTCPKKNISVTSFNYPSMTFAINLNDTNVINVSFERVVTNVGHPNSTYNAKVTADPNLKIEVVPDTLSFKSLNETQAFTVKVTGKYPVKEKILSSSLLWRDGTHNVRSPIVIFKL